MIELTNGMSALNFRQGLNSNFNELNLTTPNLIVAAESLTADDLGKIHFLSGTASNYTVDLPTAAGNLGKTMIFKGLSALTKDVTLQGVSGQLIDGEANRKLSALGLFTLISDDTDWVIINEVGSWVQYTPVWTGFSADPTIAAAEYFRVGKTCTIRITCSVNGTSNATTTTVTLPFNAATTNLQYGLVPIAVSGGSQTTVPGRCDTRQTGSNVLDLYTSIGAGAWSATLGKRVSFTFTYHMA